MLSSKIFNSIENTEVLETYFDSLDEYDAPYFCAIHMKEGMDVFISKFTTLLNSIEDSLGIHHIKIKEDLLFFTFDIFEEDASKLKESTLNILTENHLLAKIAIFHHNCLGEPTNTFRWSTQLLEQIMTKTPSNIATIEINDFADRENWPGIEEYLN